MEHKTAIDLRCKDCDDWDKQAGQDDNQTALEENYPLRFFKSFQWGLACD